MSCDTKYLPFIHHCEINSQVWACVHFLHIHILLWRHYTQGSPNLSRNIYACLKKLYLQLQLPAMMSLCKVSFLEVHADPPNLNVQYRILYILLMLHAKATCLTWSNWDKCKHNSLRWVQCGSSSNTCTMLSGSNLNPLMINVFRDPALIIAQMGGTRAGSLPAEDEVVHWWWLSSCWS